MPAPMVRRSSGHSSEISVAPIPHSPPMPIPARSRSAASIQMFVEKALSKVKSEKQIMVSIKVRTRPNRSATGPHSRRHPPPDQEQGEQNPAVISDIGGRGRNSRTRQQLAQRRNQNERVDEGIHAIQHPSAPRRPESADLIWRQRDASRLSFAHGMIPPRTRESARGTAVSTFNFEESPTSEFVAPAFRRALWDQADAAAAADGRYMNQNYRSANGIGSCALVAGISVTMPPRDSPGTSRDENYNSGWRETGYGTRTRCANSARKLQEEFDSARSGATRGVGPRSRGNSGRHGIGRRRCQPNDGQAQRLHERSSQLRVARKSSARNTASHPRYLCRHDFRLRASSGTHGPEICPRLRRTEYLHGGRFGCSPRTHRGGHRQRRTRSFRRNGR